MKRNFYESSYFSDLEAAIRDHWQAARNVSKCLGAEERDEVIGYGRQAENRIKQICARAYNDNGEIQ